MALWSLPLLLKTKKLNIMGNTKTNSLEKISALFPEWSNEQLAVIQANVAKGTTATEFAYFIGVCSTEGLNPFLKEIWCYKDKTGNLLVFAGRDGFLKKAQQSKSFKGIRSSEVREKDTFIIDIANNKIQHEFTTKERGEIVGAYAIAFRKGGEPTIEYVDFSVYNKNFAAWKSHPADMIKKVAECHALKKAFGLSGLQTEADFQIIDNKAYAIDTEQKPSFNKKSFAISLINTSIFQPEYEKELLSEIESDETPEQRLDEIIEELQNNQKGIEHGNLGSQSNVAKEIDKKLIAKQ